MADPDDLTPAQQGKTPAPETLAERSRKQGAGRLLRIRSLLTILVGLLGLLIVWLMLSTTR